MFHPQWTEGTAVSGNNCRPKTMFVMSIECDGDSVIAHVFVSAMTSFTLGRGVRLIASTSPMVPQSMGITVRSVIYSTHLRQFRVVDI